jgi:xylulokinase
MPSLLLGIDVGTTATKAVLFDPSSGIVATASRPVPLSTELPGRAEADPAVWSANVSELVGELTTAAGVTSASIAGLAVTGMVPAIVAIDSDGRPLRAAILQNDARAVTEIEQLTETLSDLDLLALTGSALTQQSVAPTALWLARHEPEVWARCVAILGSYDWLAADLGADLHVERNWAIESGLFTIAGAPLPDVFEAANLPRATVPGIRDPGDAVGVVSDGAAARTGLVAGTPIFVGGADHVLGAVAAGLASSGDWLVKLGGGGDILTVSDRVVIDARLYLDAHPARGLWLPNGCMATSGSLVRWYSALVGETDLARLDAEAAVTSPGGVLCLPYFLGEKSPLHDPDLRGAFLGLGLDDGRGSMFRAVLEGVAFGFRHHRDILGEHDSALAPDARISDGGSRSALWVQIHADVLGTPMTTVLGDSGAALGAAISAAIGAGLVSGWDVASDYVRIGTTVEPDASRTALYDELYGQWRLAAAAIAPISHTLARRSRP